VKILWNRNRISPITTLRLRGVFDTNLADKTKNLNRNMQRPSEKRPLETLVIGRLNGYVYETFAVSKHFHIKLQALLIRAVTRDKPLTPK